MRRDSIVRLTSGVLGVVLVVALVLMINWLGFRHYARADWTASKLYSLSEKTENILDSLDQEVQVTVLMTPATPLFEQTRELLQRYAAASDKVKVEFIDPERDQMRTRQLAEQFDVTSANTVVFSTGGRTKYVTSDQLADYDYSGMQMGQGPKLKAFKGEERFTSALLGVTTDRVPRVCFTTGHGEHDPDGAGADGLSQFREALKRDNLEIEKITLLSGDVPEDCDLLVVAGPSAGFAPPELAALGAYLERGGRALVLLDPVLGDRSRPSGLEPLLAAHGIEVHDDVVLDPGRALPFFGPEAVYVNEFRSHPAVDGLQGLAVLLPIARSVAAAEGGAAAVLMTTSEQGWGERDLQALLATGQAEKGPNDVAPPVPLAVAAEGSGATPPAAEGSEPDAAPAEQPGWRLVVVGNSLFLTNQQVANAGNMNLGLNAVNWLITREAALGIAPRQPEQVQLYLSAAEMRTIALISLLGLPAAAIGLGIAVWVRRRR